MVNLREAIEKLEELTRPKRGVKPSFDTAVLVLALLTLQEKGPMGRPYLMNALSIHEAQAKTLIKKLKGEELVVSDKLMGLRLSPKGEELVRAFRENVEILPDCYELKTISWTVTGAVLKARAKTVEKYGVPKLRDIAVSKGATGALLAVREGDEIVLPPKALNESEEVRELKRELKEKFGSLSQGDLLVLVTPCDKVILLRTVLDYLNLE